MRSKVVLLLALLLAFSCSINPKDQTHSDKSDDLIQMSVNVKNVLGKPLVVSVKEEKRETHTSLVSMDFKSGSTVPSMMFFTEAIYKIAKARNAAYFIYLKDWEGKDGKTYFIIGFNDDNTVDVVEFYGDDADTSNDLDFMATSKLDLFWGNK